MIEDRGTFPFQRGWIHHPALQSEVQSKLGAWAWMMAAARYQDGQATIHGQIVQLRRGQLCYSVRFLANSWGWSEKTVRRFLSALQDVQLIECGTAAGQNLITICNFNVIPDVKCVPAADLPQPCRSDDQGYAANKENQGFRESVSSKDSTSPCVVPQPRERPEEGLFMQGKPVPAQADLLPGAEVVRLGARDCEKVIARWNVMVDGLGRGARVPRVRGAGDVRERAVRKTVKAIGLDAIDRVIAAVAESAFLRGDQGSFVANFDWVFIGSRDKGPAYQRILEGSYAQTFGRPAPAKTDYEIKQDRRQEEGRRNLDRVAASLGLDADAILDSMGRGRRPRHDTIDGDSIEFSDIEMKESVL